MSRRNDTMTNKLKRVYGNLIFFFAIYFSLIETKQNCAPLRIQISIKCGSSFPFFPAILQLGLINLNAQNKRKTVGCEIK